MTEEGNGVGDWKPGFPPGKYYEGMTDDYEVRFSPLCVWHRKRNLQEAESTHAG